MTGHFKHFKISVGLVKILQSYAESMGIEFNTVAKIHGFDLEMLKNGEARIQSLMFETLWLEIASLGKDPFPGLNFGKQAAAHYPAGSILFSMMRNCATIDRAREVFVRYHRIMADNIQPLWIKNKVHDHGGQ